MADETKVPNRRKFKVWDTAALNRAMYSASDIRNTLDEVCAKEGLSIEEIKPTLISSDILYQIIDAYLAAYDSLMVEDLISIGSPHKTKPILH